MRVPDPTAQGHATESDQTNTIENWFFLTVIYRKVHRKVPRAYRVPRVLDKMNGAILQEIGIRVGLEIVICRRVASARPE